MLAVYTIPQLFTCDGRFVFFFGEPFTHTTHTGGVDGAIDVYEFDFVSTNWAIQMSFSLSLFRAFAIVLYYASYFFFITWLTLTKYFIIYISNEMIVCVMLSKRQ